MTSVGGMGLFMFFCACGTLAAGIEWGGSALAGAAMDAILGQLPKSKLALDRQLHRGVGDGGPTAWLRSLLRPVASGAVRFVGIQLAVVALQLAFGPRTSSPGLVPSLLLVFYWACCGPLWYSGVVAGLFFPTSLPRGVMVSLFLYVAATIVFYISTGEAGAVCSLLEILFSLTVSLLAPPWLSTSSLSLSGLLLFGLWATLLPLVATVLATKRAASIQTEASSSARTWSLRSFAAIFIAVAISGSIAANAAHAGARYSADVRVAAQQSGYCLPPPSNSKDEGQSTGHNVREPLNWWFPFLLHVCLLTACYQVVIRRYVEVVRMLQQKANVAMKHDWVVEPLLDAQSAVRRGLLVAAPAEWAAFAASTRLVTKKVVMLLQGAWHSLKGAPSAAEAATTNQNGAGTWSSLLSWPCIENAVVKALGVYFRAEDIASRAETLLREQATALLSRRSFAFAAVTSLACEPDHLTPLDLGTTELRLVAYTRRSLFHGRVPLPKVLWQRRPLFAVALQGHPNFEPQPATSHAIRVPIVVTARVYTAALNRALHRTMLAITAHNTKPRQMAQGTTHAAGVLPLSWTAAVMATAKSAVPNAAVYWRRCLNTRVPVEPEAYYHDAADQQSAEEAALEAEQEIEGGPKGVDCPAAPPAGASTEASSSSLRTLFDALRHDVAASGEQVQEPLLMTGDTDERVGLQPHEGATLVVRDTRGRLSSRGSETSLPRAPFPLPAEIPDDSSVAEEDEARDAWECCPQEEEQVDGANPGRSLYGDWKKATREGDDAVLALNETAFAGRSLRASTIESAHNGDSVSGIPATHARPAAAVADTSFSLFPSLSAAIGSMYASFAGSESSRAVSQGAFRAGQAPSSSADGSNNRGGWLLTAIRLVSAAARNDGLRLVEGAMEGSTVIISALLTGRPTSRANHPVSRRQEHVHSLRRRAWASVSSGTLLLNRMRGALTLKASGRNHSPHSSFHLSALLSWWARLITSVANVFASTRGPLIELELVLGGRGSATDSAAMTEGADEPTLCMLKLRFPLLRYCPAGRGLDGPLLSERVLSQGLGSLLDHCDQGRSKEMSDIIQKEKEAEVAARLTRLQSSEAPFSPATGAVPDSNWELPTSVESIIGPAFLREDVLPMLTTACACQAPRVTSNATNGADRRNDDRNPQCQCKQVAEDLQRAFPPLALPSSAKASFFPLRPCVARALVEAAAATETLYSDLLVKASATMTAVEAAYGNGALCNFVNSDNGQSTTDHGAAGPAPPLKRLFDQYRSSIVALIGLYDLEDAYFAELVKKAQAGIDESVQAMAATPPIDTTDTSSPQAANGGASASAAPPNVPPAPADSAAHASLLNAVLRLLRSLVPQDVATAAEAAAIGRSSEGASGPSRSRSAYERISGLLASASSFSLWHHRRHRLWEVCLIGLLQCASVTHVSFLVQDEKGREKEKSEQTFGAEYEGDSEARLYCGSTATSSLSTQAEHKALDRKSLSKRRSAGRALRVAAAAAASAGALPSPEPEAGKEETPSNDVSTRRPASAWTAANDTASAPSPALDPSEATAPELLARIAAFVAAIAANRAYTGSK